MGMAHFINDLAGGDLLRISGYILPLQKLEGLSYQDRMPHDRIFQHLGTIPEQTDGRTDRIALAITALCIASNADAL